MAMTLVRELSRKVAEAKVSEAGDEARDTVQHGLEARMELHEGVGVIEDQHAAVGEVVVERLEPRAGCPVRLS